MKLPIFTEQMPAQVTKEIEEFCARIAPGQTPVYVTVKPEDGAEVNRCHVNVQRHVQDSGGHPVYGWIIWQSPALLHAEFHCNWMTPEGELVDITPKADGERAILFLPDPNRMWAGQFVPSRRQPRWSFPSLARLVAVMERQDRSWASVTSGKPIHPLKQAVIVGLEMEKARLMLQVQGAWTAARRGDAAKQRAKKKADRKRRRRRGK